MSRKLRIQSFRSNDLNAETGKQIEFGRSWCEYFFEIPAEQQEATFNLVFIPLCQDHIAYDKRNIELKLSNVTGRGDRKAYKNGNNGYSQLKDFFLTDLRLSEGNNLSDYFALYRVSLTEYKLFYVPKLLYSNFIALFNDDTLIVNCQEESSATNSKYDLQQIYYGAPGTGKSHTIYEKTKRESLIRTTFHPDSDYSTFVGAYKPTMKEVTMRDLSGHPVVEDGVTLTEDKIIYEFVDQAFLQAYVQAWKFYAKNSDNAKNQYLVIEEINRGNCAQIFGDLFQLLDRNDYGFSVYPINADKDMKKQLKKAFKGLTIEKADSINQHYKGRNVVKEVLDGDILLLPNNLYIWATMNTSDQSLFPIDSAFKRRWEWLYMPIGKGYDENGQEIKWAIEGATQKFDWWSFLEKINAQVGEATQSEDKKLGFFFCKATDGIISAEKFVGKVIFYLWNDVFKNNGFEGPIFKDADGTELSFGKFYKSDMKGNAIVQKDKVELFLNNLGVEEVTEENNMDDGDNDSYGSSIKFQLNNEGQDSLKNIAQKVVMNYVNSHPSLTAQEVRDTFIDAYKGAGIAHIVETEEEFNARRNQTSAERSVSEVLLSNGEKVYVCTQLRAKNEGDNFFNFVRITKEKGWGDITPV